MSSSNVLIPAKFISIILHVIITGCILANYEDNILSANITKGTDDWNKAKQKIQQYYNIIQIQSVVGAMIITLIFLFIEIVVLFIGVNMYCDKLNIIETLAHSMGVILYSWYTLDSWRYNEIWSPWFFFSFCPMIVECYQALSSFLYYKKFNKA